MDHSAALWFAISAAIGLWALLFLPPWLVAWRERQKLASLERQRRRQYADLKRSRAD